MPLKKLINKSDIRKANRVGKNKIFIMKKLNLDDLEKGKLSANLVSKLDKIKGGMAEAENKCHLVEIKFNSSGTLIFVYDC